MLCTKLYKHLNFREISVTGEHLFDNTKADSGGNRDLHFLHFLLSEGTLRQREALLKRTAIGVPEELYLDKYKKMSHESDQHFLCRAPIQEELFKMGIQTYAGMGVGNLQILRENSHYDIVLDDFSAILDIGLTPARNFFRGLTDLRVKSYLVTTYFDEYMDDIVFSIFERADDQRYLEAVKDFIEGYQAVDPGAIAHRIASQNNRETGLGVDEQI